HFQNGITTIKQWTGTEHKEMQKAVVGLLAGAVPDRVLTVARALLDFSYFAWLRVHTEASLTELDTALATFHSHKDVFIKLEVHNYFNILKIYQLSHYIQSIRLYGSLDGFNTELSEHLHINFAKDAYQSSNKHNYKEQMVLWLQRQEAIVLHMAVLLWLCNKHASTTSADPKDSELSDTESVEDEPLVPQLPSSSLPSQLPLDEVTHVLAKSPAYPWQSINRLETIHGAVNFISTLTAFMSKYLPHNTVPPGCQDCFDAFMHVCHCPS
ncbi:hypothetical protein PAXINDRAFT_50258, partial [Paxillus involutus ATCC 200175]